MAPILVLAMAAALASLTASTAAGEAVPLPRPRPDAATGPPPAASPAGPDRDATETAHQAEVAAAQDACLARLRTAGVEFDMAIVPASANAACAIEAPLRIKAVKARSRAASTILLPEAPLVSCAFAERLSGWLTELAAPLIAGRLSADLKAVRTGPGFECRNRNRSADGKLSAHALGRAVDISAFELANGKTIWVKPDGDEANRATVDAVRTAACGWFTTVLGPGSDAAHTDHMHVDNMQHGSSERYRICQ